MYEKQLPEYNTAPISNTAPFKPRPFANRRERRKFEKELKKARKLGYIK
jgi:hypothetical protein